MLPEHAPLDPTVATRAQPSPDDPRETTTRPDPADLHGLVDSRDRIDRYLVLHELGRGGMGVVYAAYDRVLGRKVALKLLRDGPGGDEAHRRLLREARALARLSHPNVVGIYEVSELGPRVFLAMELIDGVNLRTWLGDRPRSQSEILAVFLQAADGLAAAHAAGLVHRDFKPDNVVIGADGRVRVMDFGLARLGADEPAITEEHASEDPQLTAAGTLLGTPAYMAPEQHLGLTARAVADIYSFAVALYEAVHAELPFQAADTRALSDRVLRGHVTHTPSPGRIPAWLQAVIDRGMALEPADRWPSMAAFAAALRRESQVRLRRALAVAAVITAALTLALVLPPWWHDLQLRRERDRVEELAESRLHAVLALQQGGDAARADAAFTAFVAAEEHRGTPALARAWLQRGQAAWSEGQVDAALDAMARAYIEAREPADIVAAMRAITAVHHARWQIDELGPALAVLAAHGADQDPDILRMRVDAALDHNDLPAALAALAAPASPPELASLHPLLTALARARPLGLHAERAVPVTRGDATGFVLLSDNATRLTLTDAALRPRATLTVAAGVLELVAGTPAYFAADGDSTALFAWDGVTTARLWRSPPPGDLEPRTAAWLDLGDGGSFYFGAQWDWRGFYRVRRSEAGQWTATPAHAATHAGISDLGALLASDLDGDGRTELVVGTGPWHQLDLRVLRPAGDGLELLDLRTPGRITGLATVRGAGGARLAALKDDRYAPFQNPPHTGEPAGVYLYEFADDRLVDAGHLPLPRRGEAAALPIAEGLLACDLDGDGRTDLVAGLTAGMAGSERERLPHAAVFHQRPDGGFQRVILGLQALACAQLDDDPADELIVHTATVGPGRFALWALGAGDTPTPRRDDLAPPTAVPPSTDPLLVDRWTRADQLVASGLAPAAVRLLRETAELTADERARQALLVRAAALLQDRDDARAAADLYSRAARRLALPGAVALRAVEAHVALGEFAAADRLLDALIADAGSDIASRTAAATRQQVLAPLARRSFALHPGRPLDPAWRLDPLSLRRDARAETLRIETTSGGPEIASLPLAWRGGAAALTVDLDVDHLESASSLEFALVDADDRTIVSVGVFAPRGFPRQQWITCHDPSQPVSAKFAAVATTTTALRKIRAHALWDPTRGTTTCDAEVDDEVGHFTSRPAPMTVKPGPARLVLRHTHEGLVHMSGDLRVLTVHGVDPPLEPAAAPDPSQRAALLLVEGRPAEALVHLDSATDFAVWRFLAHDRLREPAAATAALRAHLAGPSAPADRDDLLRLLRLRPDRVGPPLRELVGPGIHLYVAAMMPDMFRGAVDETWVHDLLLTEFPWRSDLDRTDPDTRLDIRLMHALALAAGGRYDEARALTRLALSDAAEPRSSPDQYLTHQWLHLAALLARDAPDEAIAAVREGIRAAPAPESTRVRTGTLPEFDILAADPAWLELVESP